MCICKKMDEKAKQKITCMILELIQINQKHKHLTCIKAYRNKISHILIFFLVGKAADVYRMMYIK